MGPIPVSFWPEPRPACTLLTDVLLKMFDDCPDDMLYNKSPLVILAKGKNHFC